MTPDTPPPRPNAQNWLAGVLFGGLAFYLGTLLAAPYPVRESAGAATAAATASAPRAPLVPAVPAGKAVAQAAPDAAPALQRLDVASLPDDPFSQAIKRGAAIFNETATHAPQFVGNDLACRNCHLDGGQLPASAPLGAAYLVYPAFRAKDKAISSFQARLQGCFKYSMNGKAPALGDPVLTDLEAYSFALAKGLPVGVKIKGQGYPKLPDPNALNAARGAGLFAEKCALCHGANGEGQRDATGKVLFPPLWGPRSYNWGAGMSSIANAAAFIKANMPFSQGGTLNDADAWDIAAFVDSHERPQDPRFTGNVAETRKLFHNTPVDLYGIAVNGNVLGAASPPFGTVPAATP